MSEQIVQSCQEQTSIAADVNHSIENINAITEECFTHIDDTKQSVHQIRNLAQNQVEKLSSFIVDEDKSTQKNVGILFSYILLMTKFCRAKFHQ